MLNTFPVCVNDLVDLHKSRFMDQSLVHHYACFYERCQPVPIMSERRNQSKEENAFSWIKADIYQCVQKELKVKFNLNVICPYSQRNSFFFILLQKYNGIHSENLTVWEEIVKQQKLIHLNYILVQPVMPCISLWRDWVRTKFLCYHFKLCKTSLSWCLWQSVF